MLGRYDTIGNSEDEYYPGTSVLVNLEIIRSRMRFNILAYFPWSPAFPAIFTNCRGFRF